MMPRGSRDEQPEAIRLEPRLFARLGEKKARLDLHRPLTPAIARRLHEDLRIRLTYHSNAIEGNTLTLRETQVVIEEGITIGGHSLREHLEATNHARAFDELRHFVETGASITIETVHRFHALVLHDLDETAGHWREQQVYIRGSNHLPPPARQVPDYMAQWVNWLTGEGLQYHPVVRAALARYEHEAQAEPRGRPGSRRQPKKLPPSS